MSWPAAWTLNFCPNPSAEVSLAGYAAIHGTEQVSQDPAPWSGQYSVRVTTPGSVPGEGITTPSGSVLASVTGAASLSIAGESGRLAVQAVQNPGGQVLASIPVLLDGSGWQRIDLNSLAMVSGDTFYLIISTAGAQSVTFWVDAVQYEPESPAHPYIDGDSPFCTWTGTPGLSVSYQEYEHPVSLSGTLRAGGNASLTAWGEVFTVGPLAGTMDMSGRPFPMAAVTTAGRAVIPPATDTGIPGLPWEIAGGGVITSVTAATPPGALSDFAIFETGTDPDPAMTLIGWNNAGTVNAADTATAYQQVFGTFSPPRQQLDSGGRARWQGASFMAAGFRIGAQPAYVSAAAPGAVNFAQVQVEKQTALGPSAYQLPRALSTIIKPTRMNYCPNPSVEVDLTGWNTVGGSSVTQVSGGYEGSYSLQVSVPSAGGSVYIAIPGLILGDTFMASAYAEAVSANINDITMSIGGISTSANPTGYVYGGEGYGSGPYGGVENPAAAMVTGGWSYRPAASFTAPQSSVVLSFTPVAVTGAAYPLVFSIDCVLVEPGEVLQPYGDGSTEGWGWELGGTPGKCRSYYYEREAAGVRAVQEVIRQHTPLGTSAYAPQYFVCPTQ